MLQQSGSWAAVTAEHMLQKAGLASPVESIYQARHAQHQNDSAHKDARSHHAGQVKVATGDRHCRYGLHGLNRHGYVEEQPSGYVVDACTACLSGTPPGTGCSHSKHAPVKTSVVPRSRPTVCVRPTCVHTCHGCVRMQSSQHACGAPAGAGRCPGHPRHRCPRSRWCGASGLTATGGLEPCLKCLHCLSPVHSVLCWGQPPCKQNLFGHCSHDRLSPAGTPASRGAPAV